MARQSGPLGGSVKLFSRAEVLYKVKYEGAQQAEARAERAVELAQERVVPAHERL